MALRLSDQTWHGRAVKEGEGLISDLRRHIPRFMRKNFRLGPGENEYLKLISRNPLDEVDLGDETDPKDSVRIPVAAVSTKKYQLVQHHDVLTKVLEALSTINLDTDPKFLEAKLRLSKYGARIWISFSLPNYDFDPGDGQPVKLKVNCLNSVDKSFAVRVQLTWYRDFSATEMPGPELRRNHDQSFKSEEIKEFLTTQLNRLSKERDRYRRWYRTTIRRGDQYKDWIDQTVTKRWGTEIATRAHHIIEKGSDCQIDDERKKTEVKTHQLEVKETRQLSKLLGFPSAENIYHISLVLSWLTNEQKAIEEQLKRLGQIRDLMDALLSQTENQSGVEEKT